MPRKRRVGSISDELLYKSREVALSAVQIFNNPLMRFKSEAFIVLMIIAWTYLLHAYYRKIMSNTATTRLEGRVENFIELNEVHTNTGSWNAA